MPVTQDYKILTLTRTEFVAIQVALVAREIHLLDMISMGAKHDQDYQGYMLRALEPVQTALTKVGVSVASMTIIDGPTGNAIAVLPKVRA